MGKIYQSQQQLQEQIQENQPQNSSSVFLCGCCSNGCVGIKNTFSFKCVFILILTIALFLSAIFWIPPFNRLTSRFDSNAADKLNVTVEGSFRLKMPVALIVSQMDTLEDDIFGEIGLPNTKVSILSMHQEATSNWTEVVFGILPDPKDIPINFVSLSVLKSTMVELFLGKWNLSLTTSIFGNASSFEILKFTGGINVVPSASALISHMPQTLFNFTLNNSISQIEASFRQFNDQLKYGLSLRPYENIYVQLRNMNGSTVDSPVTVQASVLSDIGTHSLLPQRLKQLAQIIRKSPRAKNLGLDHSVFGKVKGISLSSILNGTLPTSPSPTPSPSPSPSQVPYSSSPLPSSPPDEHHSIAPSLSPERTPTYAPAPSDDHHNLAPCYHCGTSSPHVPIPAFAPQPSSPPLSGSPTPSIPSSLTPRSTPCQGHAVPPSPVPTIQFNPSPFPPSLPPQPDIPSTLAPSSQPTPYFPPSPSISHHNQGWRKAKAPVSMPPAFSPSPSPTSSVSDPRCSQISLIGMLVLCILHLLCQPYQ